VPWLLPRLHWPAGDPRLCAVQNIHDGDTMRLSCRGERIKVRLYCIDAPELGQKPWGRQSRDRLRAITPSRVKLIEKNQDRYGRTVGKIIDPASGQSLNLAMVRAGQAAVYRRYCSDERYPAAEQEAKRQGLGIWRKPGNWQRPWEYRHPGPYNGYIRDKTSIRLCRMRMISTALSAPRR
jgi:endonuclease YncB( thermonuclease family)